MLGGRWPAGTKEWAVSLIAALTIPAAYAVASLKADPRQQNPFVYAGARGTDKRGDEMVFYYSKLPLGSDAFRQAVSSILERLDPRMNLNTEDIAIYFYDSLASAQAQNKSGAKYTVCPTRTARRRCRTREALTASATTRAFAERLDKASSTQNTSLPQDVRPLARRDAWRRAASL